MAVNWASQEQSAGAGCLLPWFEKRLLDSQFSESWETKKNQGPGDPISNPDAASHVTSGQLLPLSGSCFPHLYNELTGDFPSGLVVKNPAANAGDMGSNPGLGGSLTPWSN